MNRAENFFDIDETAEPGGAAACEVDVETARTQLADGIAALMRQALGWHRRDIRARTLRKAHEIWKAPRASEAEYEWHERTQKFIWREPRVAEPPQDGVKVTTGGGKSTVLRDEVAAEYVFKARRGGGTFIITTAPTSRENLIEEMSPERVKQIRDWLKAMPPGMGEEAARIKRDLGIIKEAPVPHRVLIAVPTHELADEANRKMPDGVTTAIYQGRESFKIGTKAPMCRNLGAVRKSLAVGADVQKTACRRGERGGVESKCEFYDECLYQAMLLECAAADVVFCAHELLFRLPAVIGEFGLVIADEGFWQKGLFGTDVKNPIRLAVAELVEELEDYPVNKRVDSPSGRKVLVRWDEGTAELRGLLERLQAVLMDAPEGYLGKTALLDGGIRDYGAVHHARSLEWARRIDLDLRPGDSTDAYKAAAAVHGKFLSKTRRRVDMWGAIGELLLNDEEATGRLGIEFADTDEGRVRYLAIMGCRPIDRQLRELPIIHADATLQFALSKYYLPRLKMAIDLRIAAPHARTTQVIGMAIGKSSTQALPEDKRTPEKEAEVAEKRKRLVDVARDLVAGRRGLVITNKDIEKDFQGINSIETGHFGAIEGIDRWGGVEVAVIIGRSLPWKTTLARYAAALTGKPIETETVREVRLVCGVEVMCWTCTDPDAELVRAAITEAGVEQAHGRVRAVNRTADNPVEICLILHDTAVPGLRVDEVVKFQAIEPGPVEVMLERGWRLESPADAHELFPDLFPTRGAARQAFSRARKKAPQSDILYKYKFIKDVTLGRMTPPDCQLAYRRPNDRRSWSAWIDPVKVPEPRAVLEEAFKEELAVFEVKAKLKRKHRRKPKAAPVAKPVADPPLPVAPVKL